MRLGYRALLAALFAVWALPARAGWVSVAAPEGLSSTASFYGIAIAGPEIWLVGADGSASVVVRGVDVPVLQTGLGATGTLRAACGMPDGSLHAFGDNRAHVSFDAATGTWDTGNLFGVTRFGASSVSCLPDVGKVYVAGADTMSAYAVLAEWVPGAGAPTLYQDMFYVAFDAGAFRGDADGVLSSFSTLSAFQGSFAALSGPADLTSGTFEAISFFGNVGLAVGQDLANGRALVLRIGADNSLEWGGDPGFVGVNDGMLVTPAFAIVAGAAGQVAVSYDWGASWELRPIPSAPDLHAVACTDPVHCFAAGANASIYRWENEPPLVTLSATVDGVPVDLSSGVLTVSENALVCLTAQGSDPERMALTWSWSEPARELASAGGGVLDGSLVPAPECFLAPPTCGTRSFAISATANDGELDGSAAFVLEVEPSTSLITQLGASFDGFGPGNALGSGTGTVTLAPSGACAASFALDWSCTDGLNPGPTQTAREFSRPGTLCAPQSVSCTVTATPDVGEPATADFTITYEAAPGETELSLTLSGFEAGDRLSAGQSGSAGLVATSACGATYEWTWLCSDGIDPGAAEATRLFDNPGPSCSDQPVQCSVTVVPDVGEPASTSFTVTLAAAPAPVVVTQQPAGFTAGNEVAAGQSATVTLAPDNGCATGYATQWSCTDGLNPPPGSLERVFTHPGSLCASAPVSCTVTVSPGVGEPVETGVEAVFAAAPGPVAVSAVYSGFDPANGLGEGDSGTVTVSAENGCATSYAYDWLCSDGSNPGTAQAAKTFDHPGLLCAAETVSCTVGVTSDLGSSGETSFTVGLAPAFGPTTVDVELVGLTGGTLATGESATATLVPHSACAASYSVQWTCSDLLNPPSTELSRPFAHPGTVCGLEEVSCTARVVPDLGEPADAEVRVSYEPAPGPTTLDLAFTGFAPGNLVTELSDGTVTVTPHAACASSYGYAWTCSEPISASGDTHVFGHPGIVCADRQVDCTVEVSAVGGEPASAAFTVTYARSSSIPTTLQASFQGFVGSSGNELDADQSGEVVLSVSNECASAIDVAWNCDDGVEPGALNRSFEHPGVVCEPRLVTCEVTATPDLGDTAQRAVEVVYRPAAPVSIGFDFSPAFSPAHSLPDGVGGTVEVRPASACAQQTFAASWRCDDGRTGTGTSIDFLHEGRLCSPRLVGCQVDVVPSPFGAPASSSFEVLFEKSPGFAPLLAIAGSYSAGAQLEEGQGVEATVTASHCPETDSYDYRWSCAGDGVLTDGASVRFEHPGRNPPRCEASGARCELVVVPMAGGLPGVASAPLELAVEYAPAFDPPGNLQIAGAEATAHELTASASIDSACPFAPVFDWTATLRGSGELLAQSTSEQLAVSLPAICGADFVDVELTERITGLAVQQALEVEAYRGPVGLGAPTSASYLPGPSVEIDCAPNPAVRLLPEPTGCVRELDWRQATGLPLQFEQSAEGVLEVVAGAESFGRLVGRSARFEARAINDDATSEPAVFEVLFVPKPFVELRHRADRPVVAVGEDFS